MDLPDAYFAGLIDGEAWVSVIEKYGTGTFRCAIDVTMTHEETVRKLYDRFGGSVTLKKSKCARHQDLYSWRVYGKNARQVLAAIRPYTITKREAVEMCIRFLKETGKW